jgi:hypothetical protein
MYRLLEAETLNVPVLEEGGEVADQGGQRGVQVVRYAAQVRNTLLKKASKSSTCRQSVNHLNATNLLFKPSVRSV